MVFVCYLFSENLLISFPLEWFLSCNSRGRGEKLCGPVNPPCCEGIWRGLSFLWSSNIKGFSDFACNFNFFVLILFHESEFLTELLRN